MAANNKGAARSQRSLLTPNPKPNGLVDRDEWIENSAEGFITKSKANRQIYRVILETLWPKGHGIPGPIVTQDEIRQAVNKAKGKPYLDVFRRLRELQGDEGFLGIVKGGTKYQLIHTNVSPKKQPRTYLSDDKWQKVLEHYHNKCAVCGRAPEDSGFQQDHKVPRASGGTDDITNWQPLCNACNIDKSVACRGCKKDCTQCGWAYPEYYRPLRLASTTLRALNTYADSRSEDPNELVTKWIFQHVNV